jgi:tRNA(Leu) C34 or U34 (ribose-2'-O)-methylase TrmL
LYSRVCAGWGLKLETVRPLSFSLYSYLTPLGLNMLPTVVEEAETKAKELLEKSPSISAQIETTTVMFFADVSPTAYVSRIEGGIFRLTTHGDDAPVASIGGTVSFFHELARPH